MIGYTAVAAAGFTALGVIWKKEDWLNLLLKLGLFGLAIWGWYIVFHA